MKRQKKLQLAFVPVAVLALASPFGCSTLSNNPITGTVCCTDFKPGTNMVTVDWGLKDKAANLQFGAAMQAIGDFSATAQGMVNDLGVACKGMAIDLGAPETAVDPMASADPNQFTILWCQQAAMKLGELKGQITLNIQPASCKVNVSAKLDCEAQCSAQAMCMLSPGDLQAACMNGKIIGHCSGQCTGDCEGSANLAVSCNGACEGSCEGTCNGTNTTGSCMGTCAGKCRGTCHASGSASASCEGTCTGSCDVAVTAPKCTGTFTPPSGSCTAMGKCDASCDASATAKAECTPPSVAVTATSNIPDKIAAVEKWMPQILLNTEGRLTNLKNEVQGITNVAANFQSDLSGDAKAVFCIVPAVAAMSTAGENISATGQASASLVSAM